MDWLYGFLRLVALVIKLLNEAIELVSKARGYIREGRNRSRRR